MAYTGPIYRGVDYNPTWQGWVATPQGIALGAVQKEHFQSGVPFVLWPESVASNKALTLTIKSLKGEEPETKQTESAPEQSFREKFPATNRTTDGHWVRSRAEMLVDNWLYTQEIVRDTVFVLMGLWLAVWPRTRAAVWDRVAGASAEAAHRSPSALWPTTTLPFGPAAQPWHSTPYQALPEVYVQNASLEIAWTRIIFEQRTIAGNVLVPFVTEGYEGFDINDPTDWMVAERLLADGVVTLPTVDRRP